MTKYLDLDGCKYLVSKIKEISSGGGSNIVVESVTNKPNILNFKNKRKNALLLGACTQSNTVVPLIGFGTIDIYSSALKNFTLGYMLGTNSILYSGTITRNYDSTNNKYYIESIDFSNMRLPDTNYHFYFFLFD